MANCVYPQCTKTANGKERDGWCKDHEKEPCHFPNCTDIPMPQSSFCEPHNAEVVFFDERWAFNYNRIMQQIAAQQRYQRVLGKVAGETNGKGLIVQGRG